MSNALLALLESSQKLAANHEVLREFSHAFDENRAFVWPGFKWKNLHEAGIKQIEAYLSQMLAPGAECIVVSPQKTHESDVEIVHEATIPSFNADSNELEWNLVKVVSWQAEYRRVERSRFPLIYGNSAFVRIFTRALRKEASRCLSLFVGGGDHWLTVKEAADAVGRDSYTITRAANDKQIVTNKKSGRQRRISAASLLLWRWKKDKEPDRMESAETVQRKLRD